MDPTLRKLSTKLIISATILSILAAKEASSWSRVAAALLRFAEVELNEVAGAEVSPVGSSVERALRGGHACEAPRIVLRGFVVLPLFAQGQHYVFYLLCTTGGGGSVSLITPPLSRTQIGSVMANVASL